MKTLARHDRRIVLIPLALLLVASLPAMASQARTDHRQPRPNLVVTSYPLPATTTVGAQVDAPYISGNLQIDAAHDGDQPNMPYKPPLREAWSVRFTQDKVIYPEAPLIADGMVFVTVVIQGAWDTPVEGVQVTALSEATGQPVWGPVTLTGGGSTAYIAYGDGRLYVAYQVASTGASGVTALDGLTGGQLWSKAVVQHAYFRTPPVALGDLVYVFGNDPRGPEGAAIYALDSATGRRIWAADRVGDGGGGGFSAPTIGGGVASLTTGCAWTYAASQVSGHLLWRAAYNAMGGSEGTGSFYHGRIYSRFGCNGDPIFTARTGQQLGTFSSGPMPAFDTNKGLSYAFFVNGSTLEGHDFTTNNLLWTFTGDGTLDSSPLVVDHVVYEGSSSGYLYAVNEKTGALIQKLALGAGVPGMVENNLTPITGMAAGQGLIVVPAGNTVVAFAGTQP